MSAVAASVVLTNAQHIPYHPYGGALAALDAREGEVCLDGPAGTGKTYAALWKLHLALLEHPGARGLMLRKTHASLKSTALVTFRDRVLPGFRRYVKWHSGSGEEPPQYRYANGSRLVVGGLDSPGKIMSSEYDMAYVNEATDLQLNDWEAITTRLRYGTMPYQQLVADCNPNMPTHWLNQRMQAGLTRRILSRHEDNPTVTPAYLARLDALTGVRYLRLRLGIWAAAEGMVYDEYDRKVHVIPRFPIPGEWPRYWVIDWGFTNPFVWQQWAMDPDGRLYREREIYMTQKTVPEHVATIKRVTADDPMPREVIGDPADAGAKALFALHSGYAVRNAEKAISAGIQAVKGRLPLAADGRPRLYLLEDSLVERDEKRAEQHLPLCTEDEIEGYVWDTRQGRKQGEEPIDRDNHAMDTMRYQVAYFDLGPRDVQYVDIQW